MLDLSQARLRDASQVLTATNSLGSAELISRVAIVVLVSLLLVVSHGFVEAIYFSSAYLITVALGIAVSRWFVAAPSYQRFAVYFCIDAFRYALLFSFAAYLYSVGDIAFVIISLAIVVGAAMNALTTRNNVDVLTTLDAVAITLAFLWFTAQIVDVAQTNAQGVVIWIVSLAICTYFNACLYEHHKFLAQRLDDEQLDFEAKQLQSVGRLTAGIAHDFNNILTAVMGNLELITVVKTPKEKDELAQEARDAAHRASIVTSQLLAFSRQLPLKTQKINLQEFFAGFSQTAKDVLGNDANLDIVFHDGLWDIQADEDRLTAALIHIVENARDAFEGTGRLEIELRNRVANTQLGSRLTPGPYVEMKLRDNGVGIPRDVIGKVFDPFFSTKKPASASGLGLSMAKGFVAQSGGRLELESTPGDGTTVILNLPADIAQANVLPDTKA
ncbi:MAG: ATP-binding protein [Pseudomonadota bacterium]